mmetsp:Transcript_4221/g.3544  ORF Transcript_4221/g.3544 Transcript_4221/m.3544 type:complete len:128 (+) Transcript_4221:181-564(+)
MGNLYDELRKVKDTKKKQRLQDIENKLCIELYRIYLDCNLNEEISVDQGISSLLYGIEQILIKTNQTTKEIQDLNSLRTSIKSQSSSHSPSKKSSLQSKLSSLNFYSNIQVLFILGLVSVIAMLVLK